MKEIESSHNEVGYYNFLETTSIPIQDRVKVAYTSPFPEPTRYYSGYDVVVVDIYVVVVLLSMKGGLGVPVKKPREQVADAEALFDLTRTLVTSVRSHNTDGITPYMFISSLLRVYGSRSAKRHSRNANTLHWKKIRHVVSPILVMPELDVNAEEITDTDKIISTMFQILRKEKRVKLENLLMKKVVPEGEELMPNRVIMASSVFTEANKPNKNTSTNPVFTEAYKLVPVDDSRLRLRITQVKKMSKNHGKVLREASDIGNSPEIGDANIGDESLKRKLL
ncbi:hypothetical protein T459_01546 [Capsicum annuum]|uniref:Non-structural maintenance of chromosomes element 4 n=1 Tax=Capsicum annuum TaxID=4072 RepID=A0A2G3AHH1_CAPAN|nr:hypothetical protein T459_01546 [Capsicum annuum]